MSLMVGTAVALSFTDLFQTSYLSILTAYHPVLVRIFFGLIGVVAGRFVLCIIYYRSSNRHWLIFLASGVAALMLHAYLTQQVISIMDRWRSMVTSLKDGNQSAREDGIPFILKQSKFEVSITCRSGDARVVRKQYLVPQRNLKEVIETDLYASGGLLKNQIHSDLWEVTESETTTVNSEIVDFVEMNRLVQVVTDRKGLSAGREYLRVTSIDAKAAFTDSLSDAFIIPLTTAAALLTFDLNLDGSCEFDESKIKVVKRKIQGANVAVPEPILTDLERQNKHISFVCRAIAPGDEIYVGWEYTTPPMRGIWLEK